MRTIELKNEEYWLIGIEETDESTIYTFPEKVYPKLEIIQMSFHSDNNIIFEETMWEAPNLKYLSISGEVALRNTQKLMETCIEPKFEGIELYETRIMQIPDFILKSKNLKSLIFRREPIIELNIGLFDLVNLEYLSFHYCKGISTIPDEIKNLINLTSFNLWEAKPVYISTELFLLPKISHISFAYTHYKNQTKEFDDALQKFKNNSGYYFIGY
jgi:hypothetical protein